jgi:hypothetical protein
VVQKCPQVSVDFAKPTALEWLDAISQSNSILSTILAVIHPDLHHTGQETMNQLRQHDKIQPQDLLCQWTSAFNSVSVICNCRTLLHQDGKTRKQWYDLLVTLGHYQNCNLDLPGVGSLLEYGPGTIVRLLGSTLEHAVDNFEGERVCYAYFMRDRVHEWAHVPGKDWMEMDYYH